MALPGLFGTRAGDLALVYGTHTVAFLLLTAATCAVLAAAAHAAVARFPDQRRRPA